ncbi:MAG TPA: hypothetical protein VIK27_00790, partial [Candidatus Aquilonibacter sp.]
MADTNDPWATAKAPPTPKPPGTLQRITNAAKHVAAFGDRVLTSPVGHALTEFAALPSEGINATLGAAQRVVASRLGHAGTNPRGVLGATTFPFNPLAIADPKAREQLGHDAYAVFHPNDPSIEANAESATGVNRLMTTDPRFRGKLRNLAVRTGFETLTDPLTFTGAGTASAGEGALQRLGAAGTAALKSPNEVVRNAAKTMLTNVAEREGGFTPREIATSNALRQRGITQARTRHTADEALLHDNRHALASGTIPEPVRQRLLQEPFVYGTPEMRQQAVALGYHPTAAETAKPPQSLLVYNLRENYDPHTGMVAPPPGFNDLLLGEEEKLRAPGAGFENPQVGAAPTESLTQRVERRLASGRAAVRHRSTVEALQQHLGVGPEMASGLATESKVGGFAPARAISRAQVDALLSTGLPHMRNIGVAAYDVMGEPGVARGLQYFTTGVPDALKGRLEEGGGAAHFGVRTPGKFSPARLLPRGVRKVTTGALDRFDQAMRAARLEQLDRTNPELTELEKMDRVNQDLGAYNQRPHYVNALSGIGGNFPQWHNYIVPTMVTRAALRQPGRVERLARTEQNANDTFLPNEGYRVTLGGPNDEGASAAADVARFASGKGASRYPKYFGGPSSLGPASLLLHPYGTLGQTAEEVAAGLVPFGNVGLSAMTDLYKSPLPPAARALSELLGIYTQKRPPGSRA